MSQTHRAPKARILTVRDVLLAAADRIEIRGHCQGVAESDGRCCALAALDRTTNDPGLYEEACEAICRYLGDSSVGPRAVSRRARIVAWNDDPDRTAAEVITVLRGAAEGCPS
jgi:hypothetical protein